MNYELEPLTRHNSLRLSIHVYLYVHFYGPFLIPYPSIFPSVILNTVKDPAEYLGSAYLPLPINHIYFHFSLYFS